MRRRLYYLADNIEMVDRVANLLHRQGIEGWNFHVLSKDDVGLYKHHLHSATPLHSQDILRAGERGALIGLLAGLVISLIVIGVFGFFQNQFIIAALVITLLVTMHGAWAGGMAGLMNENYKIKRFHGDIEAGRFLLMIDVTNNSREKVKRALDSLPIVPQGDDSIVVLPFGFGRG
ncbi:MAG TPA: YrzE family protein [Spongiibacteraceae bacterium]|jgi:hypothetical protein